METQSTPLADRKTRGGKQPVVSRLRSRLSLVAVLLLIALVAVVFIGGHLVADWSSYHRSSAGDTYLSYIAKLEARPLRIPAPKTPLDCQYGPTDAAGHLGSGPVYSYNSAGRSVSSWGFYYHNTAYADVNVQGPILIRALDLYTRQPVIFIGDYATGPVVGTDTVDGTVYEQHLELLINTGNARQEATSHKFNWPFNAGVPSAWSGSTGFQIDGVGLSEMFLVC